MIEEFLQIVGATRTPSEVAAHRAYVPNQNDDQVLAKLTLELLRIFKPVPGGCFMMSALLASGIREQTNLPVAVVVGDLFAGKRLVFAAKKNQVWGEIGNSSGTIDGHAWVQVGARLIEASALRTIRLGSAPPEIVDLVHRDIGKNKGAVFGSFPIAEPFYYQPRYVLTSDQEDSLAASAYSQFVEPG